MSIENKIKEEELKQISTNKKAEEEIKTSSIFSNEEAQEEIKKFIFWIRLQAILFFISGAFSLFAFFYIFPLIYGVISIVTGVFMMNAAESAEKLAKSISVQDSSENVIEILKKFRTISQIKVIADIVLFILGIIGFIILILFFVAVGTSNV